MLRFTQKIWRHRPCPDAVPCLGFELLRIGLVIHYDATSAFFMPDSLSFSLNRSDLFALLV